MIVKNNQHNQVIFLSELFIRLTFLVFLFAFIDSFVQFKYLIGENGIASARNFLYSAHRTFGNTALFQFPTLLWISQTDSFITSLFVIAILCTLLGIFGIFVSTNLFIVFFSWLSIVNSGSDFFIYIWDTYLLEVGFVAFLVSMLNTSGKHQNFVVFLLWFLVFRLWLSMGLVTVFYNNSIGISGDFMKYFFQNQPMPTSAAFFMYHLPSITHSVLSFLLLFIELILPFFIFIKRLRVLSFIGFCGFSILIQIFGNYAWFNILTVVTCIPLLINTKTGERLTALPLQKLLLRRGFKFSGNHRLIVLLMGFQILLQSLYLLFMFFPIGNRYLNFLNYYNYRPEFTSWAQQSFLRKALVFPTFIGSNFKIANPYGVFKGIAVKRWELEFSLSDDTLNSISKKVNYFYKPGLSDHNGFFAPHFPRLEQQLFYESQQGAFFRNFTPYENKFSHACWTKGFILNLLKDGEYRSTRDSISSNHYRFVKLTMMELSFESVENHKKTGRIWVKKPIFSFYLSNNSINCPLVPDYYFERFKKHQP